MKPKKENKKEPPIFIALKKKDLINILKKIEKIEDDRKKDLKMVTEGLDKIEKQIANPVKKNIEIKHSLPKLEEKQKRSPKKFKVDRRTFKDPPVFVIISYPRLDFQGNFTKRDFAKEMKISQEISGLLIRHGLRESTITFDDYIPEPIEPTDVVT